MAKETKKNLHREKKKKDGYSPKSYILHEDVIALIDMIDEKVTVGKSEIVAEAVKEFAKSNYELTIGKNAPTVSYNEFNSVKKNLNLLLKDYIIESHGWNKKMIGEKITILKDYKKPYSEMMKKSFYDGLNKKHQDEFYSHRLLRLLLISNASKFKKQ